MGCENDNMAEHLITALVLTLAHDLALESRRKGITGRDYVGDAVELMRQSRPDVPEPPRRDREPRGSAAGAFSEKPGRGGLQEPGR